MLTDMEIRYSVKPSRVENSVAVISYALPDDRGVARLVGIRWNGEAKSFFKQVSLQEVPTEIVYRSGEVPEQMKAWADVGCIIKDISSLDMSFGNFWERYGKKVGNKARVEKKWGNLTEEERIMAMGVIPRIRVYYERRHLELPYPETFIDQKRWGNLFE